jgi:hypothetical protein
MLDKTNCICQRITAGRQGDADGGAKLYIVPLCQSICWYKSPVSAKQTRNPGKGIATV